MSAADWSAHAADWTPFGKREARDRFFALLEALRARKDLPTGGQMRELRSRYDAAVHEHHTQKLSFFERPLPPWELFEAELVSEDDTEPVEHGNARRTPAPIAMELIEEALRIHEREGFGRRRLETAVPGLTDYTAGQILRWYRVGAPAGLWLDDKHRLKWGPAISSTPTGLRLPRLPNPASRRGFG